MVLFLLTVLFFETLLTHTTPTAVYAAPHIESAPYASLPSLTSSKIPSQTPLTASEDIPKEETFPFYSQFTDISEPQWRKVGCGIASLAMIIDHYSDEPLSVDSLLHTGIDAGAFDKNAGWSHAGLIGLAHNYGLSGETHNLGDRTKAEAFATLSERLKDGPVMASVHYKFDPESTIPHLVVVIRENGDMVYVSDPASSHGEQAITRVDFLRGWKQRYIELRPTQQPRTQT